jgi:hypothetical protein
MPQKNLFLLQHSFSSCPLLRAGGQAFRHAANSIGNGLSTRGSMAVTGDTAVELCAPPLTLTQAVQNRSHVTRENSQKRVHLQRGNVMVLAKKRSGSWWQCS